MPFPPTPEQPSRRSPRAAATSSSTNMAVQAARLQNPEEAIGKTVQGRDRRRTSSAWSRSQSSASSGTPASARSSCRSTRSCSCNASTGHSCMIVRYNGDPAAVRAGVEREWKQITNEVPFNAKFSEDIIAELYEAEDARAQIFAAFALLAVIIGCLGLFGLAAFTAERRTKEIGIRKVLGARTRDIVRLLVWQFSRPVIVANLIAWPVAWWLMRDWLNGFDTRIALGPTPFLLAGGLALAIAIGTVVGHAFRVARANPIHALRYE